jgi:rhomboid protease GluP
MAIGAPPIYTREISLDTLNKEQFLAIAQEATLQLGYDCGQAKEWGLLAYTPFSMSSWKEEIRITVTDNTATLQSKCLSNQLIDWGKNRRNIEAFLSTFQEIHTSTTPEDLALKGETMKQQWAEQANDEDDPLQSAPANQITGFLSIFKPTDGYFVTPLLIHLNLLLFIAMVATGVSLLFPDNESLIKWGANYRPVTLDGEWWRLLSSCFLHIGIFHLLMNMYALMYIGMLLEPYLGKGRLLAAYLLTGIMASLTSLYWHQLTISAGASGAIFGLYGVFLAMLTTNLIEKSTRKALLSSIAVFVGYNLLNGMRGDIDNAAHIGGLVSGLLMGYAYHPSLTRTDDPHLKRITSVLLTIAVLTISFITYRNLPNNIKTYYNEMVTFGSWEEEALRYYQMPADTPKEDLLYELRERGIYYWKKNIVLLKKVKRMDLPEPVQANITLLLQYCDLRMKNYEMLYQDISEDSDQHRSLVEANDKQIQSIIDLLQSQSPDSK